MKKRNNKIIVLIVVAVLFAVSLLIFILNYSKDNSSFSILEKKWINDNTSNVLDISVYNDVPVYGKSGKGVIFDLLDDFTTTYGINFILGIFSNCTGIYYYYISFFIVFFFGIA